MADRARGMTAAQRRLCRWPLQAYRRDGEARIGFQQSNELMHFPGVAYVGPLPAEVQGTTWRSGGIMVGARAPEAAHAPLEFLAAPVMRRYGLEPPARP
jgi:molybdate transport system substrate-binding protein